MIPLITSPFVLPIVRITATVSDFGPEITDEVELITIEDEVELITIVDEVTCT